MRISDWSSDVCSSDLGTLGAEVGDGARRPAPGTRHRRDEPLPAAERARPVALPLRRAPAADRHALRSLHHARPRCAELRLLPGRPLRSEEHTSELQSLMRISYAVFCLKKKKTHTDTTVK